MIHDHAIIRDDAIRDALRALTLAIGPDDTTPLARRMIDAVKRLRETDPVRTINPQGIDYMKTIQDQARQSWKALHPPKAVGPEHDAVADIKTPLGRLTVFVWRRQWNGLNGQRNAWASMFLLDDKAITIAGMKKAGLAPRPTTRPSRKKGPRP